MVIEKNVINVTDQKVHVCVLIVKKFKQIQSLLF